METNANISVRLLPGVIIVALQWLVRYGTQLVVDDTSAGYIGVLGGLAGGLAVLVWWAFFSRLPRAERWGGVALVVGALALAPAILHPSIAEAGMGILFYVYAVPVVSLALVAWAAASSRIAAGLRLPTLAATILLACGSFALLRSDGISGGGGTHFAWRWSPTHEERLLGRADDAMAARPAVQAGSTWPGFRGAERNGIVAGAAIATDWSAAPPQELWRRPIGPGWSSFAVRDGLVYTQEQRGDHEIVACYSAQSGEPVWRHRDPVRFWEANAGPGPRGTPTLFGDRVYAFGATGILNALDATSGAVAWSRDVAADAGVAVPTWGFSSSPLVTADLVVVAAAGKLAAYDRASGAPRWQGPDGGDGYSSPQLFTVDGVAQVLLLSAAGATSVALDDGALLWEHPWPGYPIVQPAQTADGDLLLTANESSGIRRLAVTRAAGAWEIAERWTSIRLKPYFNDFVVHQGHAYGFDGRILACIDLADGKRKWKGGRYGNGQLVLLADQDVLLVLSEKGELALVGATPDGYAELARRPAIEGKTWNHPVLAGDLLLVRNDREMAAFRLARDG